MKHVKTFLIFALVFHSPGLLALVPPLRPLVLLPFLFWVNIPSAWCGLAKLLGPGHFELSAFGYLPLTPWSWFSIVAFWTGPAIGLTLLNAYWPWPASQRDWRFSMRTLMLVTTAVALTLGALIWWIGRP